MKCLCLVLLFTVLLGVHAQDDVGLDDLINSLFTNPSGGANDPATAANNNNPVPIQPAAAGDNGASIVRPTNPAPVQPAQPVQPSNQAANKCLGECVPYYLCNNNEVITDGTGLIDIRLDVEDEPRECADYLEVCCSVQNKVPEPIKPQPPPEEQIQTGCGIRHKEGVGFRISGDRDNESEYGEFPWMVAILREERVQSQTLNTYQCGGSLIHENVVLTAAHCVDGKDATKLKIRAGEWDTQTKNELYAHQDRDVARMIVHPRYTKSNLANDVALLILREPVQLDAHISPVCLPPQDAVFDHAKCSASGWGKDVFGKEGKYQVILKKVEMPIVPFNQCQSALRTTRLGSRFRLNPSFVCAGGEAGKDTCKGDGGSPLVCPVQPNSDRYYQTGIVAWGIGCGENQIPGVYVNVAGFRNWIDGEMRKLNFGTQSYTAL